MVEIITYVWKGSDQFQEDNVWKGKFCGHNNNYTVS